MRRADSPIAEAQRQAVLGTVRCAFAGDALLSSLTTTLVGNGCGAFSRAELRRAVDDLARAGVVDVVVFAGRLRVRALQEARNAS